MKSYNTFNNDIKILGRLLADHLSPIISSLIGPEQTGFIPTRQITDNFHLASNFIQDADLFACKVMILGLNIHKAFDSVLSWLNLDSVGSLCMVLGPCITISGQQSGSLAAPPITSRWVGGTRQGCPLSPLIFALDIEPLAKAIKANPNIEKEMRNLNLTCTWMMYSCSFRTH